MYVNITNRRVEVSDKASKVDGIPTKSYCVQDWLAGGEGCSVVVWNATLSGRWEENIKMDLQEVGGVVGTG